MPAGEPNLKAVKARTAVTNDPWLPSILIDFKPESFTASLKRSRPTALGVCVTGLPPFGHDPEDEEAASKEEEVAIVVGQEDGGLWLIRRNLPVQDGTETARNELGTTQRDSPSKDNASVTTRRSTSSVHTPIIVPGTPRISRTPVLSRTSSSSLLPTVMVSPPSASKSSFGVPFSNKTQVIGEETSELSAVGKGTTDVEHGNPALEPQTAVRQRARATSATSSVFSHKTTATKRSRSRSHHPEFLPSPSRPSSSLDGDVSRTGSPSLPVTIETHARPTTTITDLPTQKHHPVVSDSVPSPSFASATNHSSNALKARLLATQRNSATSETPDRLAAIAALGRGNLEGIKGKNSVAFNSGASTPLLGIRESAAEQGHGTNLTHAEDGKQAMSSLGGLGAAFGLGESDLSSASSSLGPEKDCPMEKGIKLQQEMEEREEQEEEMVMELEQVAEEAVRVVAGLGLRTCEGEHDVGHRGNDSDSALGPEKVDRNISAHMSSPTVSKSPTSLSRSRRSRCPVRLFPHSSLLRHTVEIVPLSTPGLMAIISAEGGLAVLDTADVEMGEAFDVHAAIRTRPEVKGKGNGTWPDLSPRIEWAGADAFVHAETQYLMLHGKYKDRAIVNGSTSLTRVIFLEIVSAERSFIVRGKADLQGAGVVKCVASGDGNGILLHLLDKRVAQYDYHVGPNPADASDNPLRTTRSTANFTSMFSPAPSRPTSRAGSIKEGKSAPNLDVVGVAGFAKFMGKKAKAPSPAERTSVQHAVTIDLESRCEVAASSEHAGVLGLKIVQRQVEVASHADANIWILDSWVRASSDEDGSAASGADVDHPSDLFVATSSAFKAISTYSELPNVLKVVACGNLTVVLCEDSLEISLSRGENDWLGLYSPTARQHAPPRSQGIAPSYQVTAVSRNGREEGLGFDQHGHAQQLNLCEALSRPALAATQADCPFPEGESSPVACSISALDPTSGAEWIVTGGTDGSVRIWSISPTRLVDHIEVFPEAVIRAEVAIVPRGHALHGKLLLLSAGGTLAVFDLFELDLLYMIPGGRDKLLGVILKDDDLVIAYTGGRARVWSLTALEFRRSTSTAAAEETLTGDWQWLVPPKFNRKEDALSVNFVDLARWEDKAGELLPRIGALLTTSEPISMAPVVDILAAQALGLKDHCMSLYPEVSRAEDVWTVSSNVSGFFALLGTVLARPLLNDPDQEAAASSIITEISAVLPAILGHTYIDIKLDLLARLNDHSDQGVHQCSRVLLEARLARLNDLDAVKLVDAETLHLPTNVPKAILNTTKASYATLLIGGLALRRFNLFSSSSLKDISTSILMYLVSGSSRNQALAVDLCHRGFGVWQNYVDPSELLRSLFALAVPTHVNAANNALVAQARVAVLHLAADSSPMFITTLSMDIMDARSVEERGSVMRLCVFVARKKPRLLFPSVPRVAEAVVKSLDPTRVHMRESIQETATIILNELVSTYPVIDFASKVQRLAVGTLEGAVIMYDLKTATRLYVVETHQSRVSALAFSPDGRRLVTVSVEEKRCTVWKVGSSFSSLFNIGGLPRQGGGSGEPFRTFEFALPRETQAIDPATGLQAVDISWPAERSVCLTMGMVKMTFVT